MNLRVLSWDGPTRWLVAGNLILAVLLGSIAGVALYSSKQAHTEKARDSAESMTNGLRQMLGSEIRQVDMALLNVRSARDRHPDDRAEIEAVLADQLALLPWADSLRITDASGIVRHGPGVSGMTVDLSDRPFFKAAKASTKDELIFSEPLQARISKKWVIAFARRLQKSDGTFDGVVYANVAADAFRQRFAEVDVGIYGAISLRTANRQLVARHAPGISEPPAIGSSKVSSELERALVRNARAGFFISATALDGVERMSAYQAIDDYPFIILVGLSTADYFAAWRREAAQIGVLLLLSFSTLVGASYLVLRSRRRERESAQLLMGEGLRNRALLRAASDGVQVLDREGHVSEASESLARMLGTDRKSLVGQHVSAWDMRFPAKHINEWLRAVPLGEQRQFESRYRRNDGSIFDVEVQASVAEVDGQEYVYCSVRDVSERKRLNQQLIAAINEVRDLYDEAPCAYYSLDADGRIVRMNTTGLRWLGGTAEEVIGQSPGRFLQDEGRAQFKAIFPRFISEGRIEGVEFELVPLVGQTRRVRMSSVAVRNEAGGFLMSRSVMHDVSDAYRAQEVRLTAARLEAENRQFREANRVKRAFLSNVSHEMRTPLNGILGLTNLLRSGAIDPGSPKFAQFLDQVDGSGQKLLKLIEAVLQIANAESGRLEVVPEPTDVQYVVATVLSMFDRELKAKSIKVEVSVEQGAERAVLDPLRLVQALASYVSNAVKFSTKGGLVQVMASVVEDNSLRVEVTDSGIGIAPEHMSRLFVDFQQLSEGHTKAFEGLGVGLALTKRIVEAQKGKVSARSEVGRGSSFVFQLPGVILAVAQS